MLLPALIHPLLTHHTPMGEQLCSWPNCCSRTVLLGGGIEPPGWLGDCFSPEPQTYSICLTIWWVSLGLVVARRPELGWLHVPSVKLGSEVNGHGWTHFVGGSSLDCPESWPQPVEAASQAFPSNKQCLTGLTVWFLVPAGHTSHLSILPPPLYPGNSGV